MLEFTEEQIAAMSADDMDAEIGKSLMAFLKAKSEGEVSEDIEQDAAIAGLMFVCKTYTELGIDPETIMEWFDTTTGTAFELTDGLFTVTVLMPEGVERSVGFTL